MPLGFSTLGSTPFGASFETTTASPIDPLPGISGVTVIPSSVILQDKQSQDFNVLVTGNGNYDASVVWSSPFGAIDANGLLTLPSVGTQRTFEIKATSVADPTKIGKATVTQLASAGFIMVAPARQLKTRAGNWYGRDIDQKIDGDTFYLSQGYWVIDKDVDDSLYYSLDVGPDVEEAMTGIDRVTAIDVGVTLIGEPVIQNTEIVFKVSGGDLSNYIDTVNSVTLRIYCTNGENFDRTIYFAMKEN